MGTEDERASTAGDPAAAAAVPPARPPTLEETWRAAWPAALAAWSSYTLLRDPTFFFTGKQAAPEGMAGEIAAIRLRDQMVMVNLEEVKRRNLADLAVPILAHEIGHHVYTPGNLTDNARCLAAIRRIVGDMPADLIHMVANLYQDMLLNDRLQRRAGIDVAEVYRRLQANAGKGAPSEVWKVYTRAYEHLWRLPKGTLAPADLPPETDADALLLARIVRHFAGDWLRGTRRYASVLYTYLAADRKANRGQTFVKAGLHDTKGAGAPAPGETAGDAVPDGLTDVGDAEESDEDGFEEELGAATGAGRDKKGKAGQGQPPTERNTEPEREGRGTPGRQCRTPFEYGQLLKSLGLDLSQHEVTTRYYRERALPHLIPFPSRKAPHAVEPLAEGYETWDVGEPIEALDWFGSVLRSPVLVPGVTTVQRVYGESPGTDPARVPTDLDIYVDSSGSMPDPSIDVSYLALAATILALSALRAGARVQATLWSHTGRYETSAGFLRDEKRILGIVTGCINGGTAFPLNVLRDTYRGRKPGEPPAHIVVISDDGADTMLQKDEEGTPGAEVCAQALAAARAGGTLVLNLPDVNRWHCQAQMRQLGFRVHGVQKWEDLVAFARAFVRETYEEKA